MKTLDEVLMTNITSEADAKQYLRDLFNLECLYHPDDDAADIIDGAGLPLFTALQADHANGRMLQVQSFVSDPCEVILSFEQ